MKKSLKKRKKRIAFIIDTLNKGGTEKATLDLVNSLDSNKYDITLIRFYPDGLYAKQVNSYIKNKVKYPFGNLFFWNKKLKEKVNWRGRWILDKLPPNVTHKLFVGDKYDVEIACGFYYPTKVISASKKAKKISWVHMDYTIDKSEIGNFTKKQGQDFFGNMNKVVCVSKECEDKFNEKFDMCEKTCFRYNIIETDRIIEASKEPIADTNTKGVNVIAVGRLTWQKGFDRLLVAHKNLIEKGARHFLTIIGEGEDKDKLISYINSNGLENSVKMLGFVENPYPYIKNADVFVCSSRHESYGLAVAESIVLETPIVTTDCAGPKELVGGKENGIVVENSEKGIENGLERLITNKQLREKMQTNIKERKKFFDKNILIRQWETILDEE